VIQKHESSGIDLLKNTTSMALVARGRQGRMKAESNGQVKKARFILVVNGLRTTYASTSSAAVKADRRGIVRDGGEYEAEPEV
jgi:hypothetical protein